MNAPTVGILYVSDGKELAERVALTLKDYTKLELVPCETDRIKDSIGFFCSVAKINTYRNRFKKVIMIITANFENSKYFKELYKHCQGININYDPSVYSSPTFFLVAQSFESCYNLSIDKNHISTIHLKDLPTEMTNKRGFRK